MRGITRGALVAVVALTVPAQASASIDVSTVSGEIRIESTNNVLGTSIDYLPSNAAEIPDKFRISEAGGNATTSDGDCEASGSSIVLCEDNSEDKVVVEFGSNGGFINLLTLVSQLPGRFSSEIALGNGSDTVDGTDGTDTVTTSNTSDVSGDTIDTYDGADAITTADGGDLINGGDGADVILANDGNNVINGGESAADDFDDGGDNITGGDLFDLISGGLGNDTINGGGGSTDTADDDEITGDDGNDTINGGGGEDEIDGGDNNDDVNGEAGVDDLLGGADTDTLDGGEGGDTLDGQGGTDTLNGDGGDDTLLNSDGADAFNGGADTAGDTAGDEVDYTPTSSASIRVTIDGSANDGRNCPSTCEGDNVGTTVENVTGDSAADTLIGSTSGNILDGAGGNDTLAGGPGAAATDGADRYIGGTNSDTVTFGAITGTTARSDSLTITVDGTANDGESGEGDDVETDVENVTGGTAGDTITGSAQQNELRGGAGTGNDQLTGGIESDTLFGGDGSNAAADGADIFNGGAHGAAGDTVSYAGRTTAITADLDGTADDGSTGENDDINTDVENLTGGGADDTLTGNGSVNRIDGASGNDTLAGGSSPGGDGSDNLVGNSGTEDLVTYAARIGTTAANDMDLSLDGVANDGLEGELDNISTAENLIGGGADDDITGNGSANELTGGEGDDELRGGTGSGADGADTFSGGGHGTLAGQNGFLGDQVSYDVRSSAVNISIGGDGDGATGENDSIGTDVEQLEGGSGADTITGGATASLNFLTGNAGNDTLAGGPGPGPDGQDHFLGGADIDTVTYATRTDPITTVIDDPSVIGSPFTTDNDDITSDIENLTGGTANDTLVGNDSDNTLGGGPGSDTLRGGQTSGDGADEYFGGNSNADSDTVSYSHRSDDINADIIGGDDDSDGDDVQSTIENITGGSGDDTLTGSPVANILTGGSGDDLLAGGSTPVSDGLDVFAGGANGTAGGVNSNTGDTVDYAARTENLTLSIGGNPDAPEGEAIPADIENVSGGLGNDTITGSSVANILRGGGDGDDTLAGGESVGPDGADVFLVGAGTSTNTDTVTYAIRDDGLTIDIGGGADDIDGDDISADTDVLVGGSNDDVITGDADANTLEGGGGEDTLTALAGIDTVRAQDGFADTVDCGTEADTAILDEGTLDTQTDCETIDQPLPTPPQTTILTRPADVTTLKRARFTFEANEAATFVCKLDSEPAAPCNTPKTFRNLDEGRHRVAITATDLAGQADPTPARDRWKVE